MKFDMEIECFLPEDFYYKHNRIALPILEMLGSIPGSWQFSSYTKKVYDDMEYHFVAFEDLDDEDRSFSMEWDNEDKPFKKADITITND